MSNLSFVKKSDIKAARIILIRVDFFNYHLFSTYFSDFLAALIKENKKVIIAASLGGELQSFRSLQKKISKDSKMKIKLVKDDILKDTDTILKKISKLKSDEIILLENIDFYEEEKLLSLDFSQKLASLADLCIIDSFSLFDANKSSIALLPLQIKTVYSDSVKYYSQELEKFYKNILPHKSLLFLGGDIDLLRVESLNKIIARFDYILLGSYWADYFAKSSFQTHKSEIREKLEAWRKRYRSKIIFPLDFLVLRQDKKEKQYKINLIKANELLNNDIIVDLGPETIRYYALLLRTAQDIVYDQLLSSMNNDKYQYSDVILSRAMANRSRGKAYGIVLGKDLINLLEKENLLSMIDLIIDEPHAFYRFMNIKK